MPFWRKETEAERQAKERQQAAIAAIERGEIPPIARDRILRERAYGKEFFASDLSSREYMLTREAGFQTLGQVMGTSFYRIGFWGSFSRYRSSTGEIQEITKAHTEARRKAIERLKQEAHLLGASGVIGVRINARSHDWSSGVTEFTAFGSAIKIPGWPVGQEPFTSALNGQEFWQLYRSGYMPLSVVMGTCSYYMHMDYQTRQSIYQWFAPNQELPTFTNGYKQAARMADLRMQSELSLLKADGAVGVSIEPKMETIEYEYNNTSYYDLLLHFTMLGTAVAAHPEREQKHSSPLLVLNLASKSYGRLSSTADYENSYFEPAGTKLIDKLDEDDE
ncbi:MAG: heavy metal-binding domain-containing protein [Candidatus Obscuribacterales bacterium]|nr:heavy metal-binding domain-containing protein [Candidatus Obscuribacterales bacterium]